MTTILTLLLIVLASGTKADLYEEVSSKVPGPVLVVIRRECESRCPLLGLDGKLL